MTTQTAIQPDIGIKVTAYYFGNQYAARVVGHGRKYPRIMFTLKNGRVVKNYATIIEHNEPLPDSHRGVLCRMLHPTAYDR